MSEQLSPLARSDRTPRATDARRTSRVARLVPGRAGGPDPVMLTITGVLLFVVLVLVFVFRTLYPAGI